MESKVSKSYDRIFKSLAEDDPLGLLYLFCGLDLNADVEVSALDREVRSPVRMVDHVFRVKSVTEDWLAHFEAQTHYQSDLPSRLLGYAATLALQYRLPVRTTLVLLVEQNAPRSAPSSHREMCGSLSLSLDYRVIRLWELDSTAVLRAGRPKLLPWVTLMGGPEDVLSEALRQVRDSRDPGLAAQTVILGGLRYDENALVEMLGRNKAMISDEIVMESSYSKKLLRQGMEQGLEKGLEKGVLQGRLEEARRNVRKIAQLRFAELVTLPDLDSINDPAVLEELHDRLILALDAAAAKLVIDQTIKR